MCVHIYIQSIFKIYLKPIFELQTINLQSQHYITTSARWLNVTEWRRNSSLGEKAIWGKGKKGQLTLRGLNWLCMCVSVFACLSLFTQWSQNQILMADYTVTEKPEIKLPTSTGSSKKQESSRKTSISVLLTMPKPLTVWITINCGIFWRRWKYQTTWPAFWETCMQVRKEQLELDMEQQTGSKSGKEYVKAVYCHPAYLTYMQSTSREVLSWR